MKIEKVNDRQIRCTLSRKELEQRDLKLTEIAYGNEKVKALFKDMMAAASIQFGFEADDIPLMIEVIPYADRCVVVITKVEDPEELDTRFSRFAPSVQSEEGPIATLSELLSDIDKSDELSDLFKRVKEIASSEEKKVETDKAKPSIALDVKDNPKEKVDKPEIIGELTVYFEFDSLKEVLLAASSVKGFKLGHSNLYKNKKSGTYILEMNDKDIDKKEFLKICNVVSEYGNNLRDLGRNTRFLIKEHMELMVAEEALNRLATIE